MYVSEGGYVGGTAQSSVISHRYKLLEKPLLYGWMYDDEVDAAPTPEPVPNPNPDPDPDPDTAEGWLVRLRVRCTRSSDSQRQ